jgi:uncharacterized RDD family membrane protein YckC
MNLSQSQSLPAWKEELNAKLSAHRSRRGAAGDQPPLLPGLEGSPAKVDRASARIAAKVAERYANVPSYREVLAQEAAIAARAAQDAAEAAIKAQIAVQAVLDGMDDTRAPEATPTPESDRDSGAAAPQSRWEEMREPAAERAPVPASAQPPVVHYRVHEASLPPAPRPAGSWQAGRPASAPETNSEAVELDLFAGLDDDPIGAATIEPAQPLPARVIEFPRELVASRKARPRLEEGPLRTEDERAQLRIFEVEPESVSHSATLEPVLPEWHSIRLDASPKPEADTGVTAGEMPEQPLSRFLMEGAIYSASLGDRLMAGIVDVCLVLGGFLLFAVTFVACTAHPPTGKPAVAGAAVALAAFFLLYQWMFFSFAEATPGMRYAKIALCTFSDENPTRAAMRGRIVALMLAALPLGLGFLWAFFDDDRLGWHDRMTRTYQRSYREL